MLYAGPASKGSPAVVTGISKRFSSPTNQSTKLHRESKQREYKNRDAPRRYLERLRKLGTRTRRIVAVSGSRIVFLLCEYIRVTGAFKNSFKTCVLLLVVSLSDVRIAFCVLISLFRHVQPTGNKKKKQEMSRLVDNT